MTQNPSPEFSTICGSFSRKDGQLAKVLRFSNRLDCGGCSREFIPPEPRLFSFNNPRGACPECNGLGTTQPDVDWEWATEEQIEQLAPCPVCKGLRLRKEALFILIGNQNIAQLSKMTALDLRAFLKTVTFSAREKEIAEKVTKEIFFGLKVPKIFA